MYPRATLKIRQFSPDDSVTQSGAAGIVWRGHDVGQWDIPDRHAVFVTLCGSVDDQRELVGFFDDKHPLLLNGTVVK